MGLTQAGVALDAEVLGRLRFAVMRLARQLRQHAGTGATPSQSSALATIARIGPLSLGALAAAERVGSSTVTKVVAALESAGLVDRGSDPADRRVALVGVTPAGIALLTRGRAAAAAYLGERLAVLDDDELATLLAALPVLERLVAE